MLCAVPRARRSRVNLDKATRPAPEDRSRRRQRQRRARSAPTLLPAPRGGNQCRCEGASLRARLLFDDDLAARNRRWARAAGTIRVRHELVSLKIRFYCELVGHLDRLGH